MNKTFTAFTLISSLILNGCATYNTFLVSNKEKERKFLAEKDFGRINNTSDIFLETMDNMFLFSFSTPEQADLSLNKIKEAVQSGYFVRIEKDDTCKADLFLETNLFINGVRVDKYNIKLKGSVENLGLKTDAYQGQFRSDGKTEYKPLSLTKKIVGLPFILLADAISVPLLPFIISDKRGKHNKNATLSSCHGQHLNS